MTPVSVQRQSGLLCVLANPPLTSGAPTLRRVFLAAEILGVGTPRIVNLFADPTYRTGDISGPGASQEGWQSARPEIEAGLRSASSVLIAYGLSNPLGSAGIHHKTQVAWLQDQIVLVGIATYQFGGGPRHPSRWQRWTSRHHPGLPFETAVRAGLELA